MNVSVNNVVVEVTSGATILDVPLVSGLPTFAGLAIAVNETIVPRDRWGDYQLQPSDKIILIRATQGG